MKNLILILPIFITTLLHSQSVVKDTVYLQWRETQFFEVSETVLDNGQRQLNERPLGDTLQTLQSYVEFTEKAFTQLSDAAKIMIQKNSLIQNVNKINTILSTSFNTDIITISTNVVKEVLQGDYKFKLPEFNVTDITVTDFTIKYEDKTYKIIPIGTNYIQLIHEDKIYELYKLAEGQYASIDASALLIKQNKQ